MGSTNHVPGWAGHVLSWTSQGLFSPWAVLAMGFAGHGLVWPGNALDWAVQGLVSHGLLWPWVGVVWPLDCMCCPWARGPIL
jgi:hypothetical protein